MDPTIRFEQGTNHVDEVNEEKRGIYVPCVEDLSRRYNIPQEKWEVVGLLFGAQTAAIPSFVASIFKRFGISLTS